MAKVKILIVENELLISDELQEHLLSSGYEITNCVTNGNDALLSIKSKQPDIIIMDIELDGNMDGIQTVSKINEISRVPVIYLTQHHNKRIINRVKKTFPASFLIKPYMEHEINISIELAIHNFANNQLPQATAKDESRDAFYILNDRIFIKKTNNYEKVNLDDIFWIVAKNQYTYIYTATKRYTISNNLKTTENKIQKLKNQPFIRISKSMIVHSEKIDSFYSKGGQLFVQIISDTIIIDSDNIIKSTEIEPNLFQYEFAVGREYKKNLSSFLHIL
jgi:DNA-binding LytR/AlgR family response regulator